MKILVLGGGMLGHQLLNHFSAHHDVRITLREKPHHYSACKIFSEENAYYEVNVRSLGKLSDVLLSFQPEVVINAIGIVKQRSASKARIPSIEINALFPHQLSQLCESVGARLVHISTDCVFSGMKGGYVESDFPDANDLYGRSKLLGEVTGSHCVTLRTSIIGLELARKKSLIEWYLAQRGEIKGFKKAIYSGVTTQEMARIIEFILCNCHELHGLWHVASKPINKYDLLLKLTEKLGRTDITLRPETDFVCDRSLIGDAFINETGYTIPEWDEMLDELASEIKKRSRA